MSITDTHGAGPTGPIYGYEPPVTAQLDETGGGVARAVAGLGSRTAQHDMYQGEDYPEDEYPEDLVQAAWNTEYEGDEADAYEDEDAYDYGEWTEAEIAAFHATASSGNIGKVGAWAGALCSVALVAGLGIWGYDLAMRDLNGVPVVAALEGPMRVAPVDPEGETMAHQGLAVNEVQAEGVALPAPDTVALAPAAPALTEEDMAALDAPVEDEMLDIDFTEADLATPEGVEALAAQIAAGAEPLAPVEPAIVVAGNGPATSLRPAARPARLAAVPASAIITDVQTTSADTREADPSAIAPGTHLVQVGAFPSRDLAMTEWTRLSGRFGAYFEGKSRLVVEASSGGRSFFRLRAVGFSDMAEARGFCSALIAGSADCIPVISR